MRENLITTKCTHEGLRLLRLIAAATGEKQYRALDRLLTAEAERLGLLPPPKPKEAK